VQPNELKVRTLMPPNMVVRMRPSLSLVMNGILNTEIPDAIKLKAVKKINVDYYCNDRQSYKQNFKCAYKL
jgi:hypothetical protein